MATDLPFEHRLRLHLEVPGRGGGAWLSDTQCRAVCELVAVARRILAEDDGSEPLADGLVQDLRVALAGGTR